MNMRVTNVVPLTPAGQPDLLAMKSKQSGEAVSAAHFEPYREDDAKITLSNVYRERLMCEVLECLFVGGEPVQYTDPANPERTFGSVEARAGATAGKGILRKHAQLSSSECSESVESASAAMVSPGTVRRKVSFVEAGNAPSRVTLGVSRAFKVEIESGKMTQEEAAGIVVKTLSDIVVSKLDPKLKECHSQACEIFGFKFAGFVALNGGAEGLLQLAIKDALLMAGISIDTASAASINLVPSEQGCKCHVALRIDGYSETSSGKRHDDPLDLRVTFDGKLMMKSGKPTMSISCPAAAVSRHGLLASKLELKAQSFFERLKILILRFLGRDSVVVRSSNTPSIPGEFIAPVIFRDSKPAFVVSRASENDLTGNVDVQPWIITESAGGTPIFQLTLDGKEILRCLEERAAVTNLGASPSSAGGTSAGANSRTVHSSDAVTSRRVSVGTPLIHAGDGAAKGRREIEFFA